MLLNSRIPSYRKLKFKVDPKIKFIKNMQNKNTYCNKQLIKKKLFLKKITYISSRIINY